jgi:hypothetical protein
LQTDVTGSVTYTGIDFGKVGLQPLGDLIAVSNKVPALQAKASPKSTVLAQLDFNLPQSYGDYYYNPPEKDDVSPKWRKKPKPVTILGLNHQTRCASGVQALANFSALNRNLYIEQWLTDFFTKTAKLSESPDGNKLSVACVTKLTLKTQFILLFDFSGAANLNVVPTLALVPVNGLSFDASPAFTHTLQIVFSMASNHNSSVCGKTSEPARISPTVQTKGI